MKGNTDDIKIRLEQLKKIQKAIACIKYGQHAPIKIIPQLSALAGLIGGYIGTDLANSASISPLLVSALCGCIGYILGLYIDKKLTTNDDPWEVQLYRALADYDPVDKDAYKKLQNTLREGTDADYLMLWLMNEFDNVDPSAGTKSRKAFLEKKVQ